MTSTKPSTNACLTIADLEQHAVLADPTPEMLRTPEFRAVWDCIKRWDIGLDGGEAGYSGATGNHVRAILEALAAIVPNRQAKLWGEDLAIITDRSSR